MKKLSFKQIIEKLKSIFPDGINDFAYEEIPCTINDYPEVMEAQNIIEYVIGLFQ